LSSELLIQSLAESEKSALSLPCEEYLAENIAEELNQWYADGALEKAVLNAKENGMSDTEIGIRFGVSPRKIEAIITKAYGINISTLPKQVKSIRRWAPINFQAQTSTVWSFKNRGDWATHSGHYRGNWSPHIPRNVIMRYSKPGDMVLDYFAGGGTTAVEAKLLGRRCIARDINPDAVNRSRDNLDFQPPTKLFDEIKFYEPIVEVGDARDLCGIEDSSVDLICAHPPYADIIKYSNNISSDLSHLKTDDFVDEIAQVAKESFRVLKPGGKCAILIGDMRKQKHVVPLGFRTIRAFLNAGFALNELAIKRQHNCKTTGFWYTRSIEYNFLLLAHEYLPIFEKPQDNFVLEHGSFYKRKLSYCCNVSSVMEFEKEKMETTTVWVLPQEKLDQEIKRNLITRFALSDTGYMEYAFDKSKDNNFEDKQSNQSSLIYIRKPNNLLNERAVARYRLTIGRIAEKASSLLPSKGYFVIETKDFRTEECLWPMGFLLWEDLSGRDDFTIKEIVVVPEEKLSLTKDNHLQINHRYLLIFAKR